MTQHHSLPLTFRPKVFDYFAGGGGASEGILQALGYSPDVAINHCPQAIAMHTVNHPLTHHLKEDVRNVDPVRDLPAGDVGLAWFSPSCTHFSRARGGKPVSKQLRALPWCTIRVAARRRPAVIILENVAEFRKWGPVARDGVPVKGREGQTFRRFVRELVDLGYVVEDRVLDAADYGAPTHRKRLFLIARCDGHPIFWPEPSHGPARAHPFRTAAECIDWDTPSLSIFATRAEARAFAKEHKVGIPKRPLAEATQRRIAEGLRRFLFDCPRPFIVQVNHGRDVNRSRDLDLPMPTITAKHGFGLVAPTLIQRGYGERKGQAPRVLDLHKPLGTVVAGGQKHALVSAFLTKFYGTSKAGQTLEAPAPTVTAQGQHVALVLPFLSRFYGQSIGQSVGMPAPTASRCNHSGLVAAFLTKYYGENHGRARAGQAVDEPAHTLTTARRLGLVTVELDGEAYEVADIGLRMLSPRELARAQGFNDSYQLTGTLEQQVARVGNSVPPQLAAAVITANIVREPADCWVA